MGDEHNEGETEVLQESLKEGLAFQVEVTCEQRHGGVKVPGRSTAKCLGLTPGSGCGVK